MRISRIILSYIIVTIFFTVQTLQAQKKVEYGGYFELGGRTEYKDVYVESFYRAKLETKFKINDFVKVEFDLRANSEDRQVELHEASASFKLDQNFKLEVGSLKKRYGLEEQVSHEKLTAINESMINEYFEPLGFVSRDPGVQLHWSDPEGMTKITGGVHYNESHRLTIMTRMSSKGLFGLKQVGAGFQLARERDNELPHTYIASIDAAQDLGPLSSELELFTGQDPIESHYMNMSGEDGLVSFFGARTTLATKFMVDSSFLSCIEPFFQGGLLVKDVNQFDVNSYELLLGCNIYFDEDVRLMINGDLMLSNHAYDKDERTMYGSNIIAQLQIRW